MNEIPSNNQTIKRKRVYYGVRIEWIVYYGQFPVRFVRHDAFCIGHEDEATHFTSMLKAEKAAATLPLDLRFPITKKMVPAAA